MSLTLTKIYTHPKNKIKIFYVSLLKKKYSSMHLGSGYVYVYVQ